MRLWRALPLLCLTACGDPGGGGPDAGVTACGAEIIDVPGVDGSVRGCSFDCSASGCPAGFECRPDAAMRCSPDAA